LKKETNGKFAAREQLVLAAIPGYVVLGYLVARASGKSYGEFLRQRIFVPVKMNHTVVVPKGKKNEVSNRAFGHSERKTQDPRPR